MNFILIDRENRQKKHTETSDYRSGFRFRFIIVYTHPVIQNCLHEIEEIKKVLQS